MRGAIRWFVGVVTIVHGLVHLMGVADRVGWDGAGTDDVGTPMAGIWAGTALLVVVAGVTIIRRRPGWWPIAAVAAAVSQGVILTEWQAARAGTIANVVLAAAAFYGYKSHGPTSARARFERLVERSFAAAADVPPAPLVTEAELGHLPSPVATWVRHAGAVDRPRVVGLRARIHGRIRSGPEARWMPFTGEQVNTFWPSPTRLFLIDATMFGLPVDVLHVYRDGHATMDADLASIVNTVHAAGSEMDVAETVTVLNDLCLLEPAVLIGAPLTWHPVDEHRVGVELGVAGRRVSAELVFDADGRLADFVSDDRLRSSPDGRTFTRQRWSTPIDRTLVTSGRMLVGSGRGRWDGPEGEFDYIEFHVDAVEYVEHPVET